MFLCAVSGGLVALGLIGTASRVGTAFSCLLGAHFFLPTLAFVSGR